MDLLSQVPPSSSTFTNGITTPDEMLTLSNSSLPTSFDITENGAEQIFTLEQKKNAESNFSTSSNYLLSQMTTNTKVDLLQDNISSILESINIKESSKTYISPAIEESTKTPILSTTEETGFNSIPSPGIAASVDAECEAFCRHINSILSLEKLPIGASKYLPLETCDFFERLRDGVILAFLINSISSGIIPISAITIGVEISYSSSSSSASYKSLHNANENLRLVLKAARNLGSIHLVNIGTEDIISCNKSIVLGLVWQLIRSWYVVGVNNSNFDNLSGKEKTESSQKNVSAESILIRWINDTLNLKSPVTNLGTDLVDCKAYAILLDTLFIDLNPNTFSANPNSSYNSFADAIEVEPDYDKRAELIAQALSSTLPYVRAEDISNARLNLCIIADLFKISQSQAKINAVELKNTRVEISGWEATLGAERSLYASQLATLTEQHSMEVERLEKRLSQTESMLAELRRDSENKMDSIGISIAALATRINQLCPEDGKGHLPLSVLLQNNSSHMELIAYCQTQLDLIEEYQKQLIEDKSKLYTTISLNKQVNELMSARVREFSQELAAKKKASVLSAKRAQKSSFKEKVLSWASSSTTSTCDQASNHNHMVSSALRE